jgi:hypothetical protein
MAEWRPTPGQHVQLHGLNAKQHNATYGVVLGPEASTEAADCWAAAERVPVRRADQAKLMCVKAGNLRPAPFAVQPVEGKGMGAVATRDIAKGERLLLEPPLLSIASGGGIRDLTNAMGELGREQQEAAAELTACSNHLDAGLPNLMAIFQVTGLTEPEQRAANCM